MRDSAAKRNGEGNAMINTYQENKLRLKLVAPLNMLSILVEENGRNLLISWLELLQFINMLAKESDLAKKRAHL